MKKNLLILCVIGILSSCAVLSDRMINVDLGMTKEEVMLILVNKHTIERIVDTPEGRVEVLEFRDSGSGSYHLHFLNNKLIEIEKYDPNKYRPQNINIIEEQKEKK